MHNLFKKIRPIKDAQKNASQNRINASKITEIKTDVKNILDKPINRVHSGLETIVSSNENAFIILGKSREDSIVSGPYAVSGVVSANSIDLSVGLGYHKSSQIQDTNQTGSINPSPIYDKARVYITEALYVDKVFGITKYGTEDNNEKLLSGVIVKADTVRVISRSNIKLIATTILDDDKPLSDTSVGGIELIGGSSNTNNLQPMVLGNNLISTLNDIIGHINNLQECFTQYLVAEQKWDEVIAQHMHLNPFPNTPDPNIVYNLIPRLLSTTEKISKTEVDQLINSAVTQAKMLPISSGSLLSSYHKLN